MVALRRGFNLELFLLSEMSPTTLRQQRSQLVPNS